ncbi:MAG TPA: 3-keto-5-aminohexanoate cleavage protein [Alphaproteobacteria bacterium]|nr:3-keto-5-aminohexanoate cleavage protein [Alphaproteobacteria bacterium]
MAPNVWLEVALNGPWSRAVQPRIPITVDEIVREGIACAEAGAAIIHVHAYDPATGRQKDDAETYAAIIEGIRGHVDAIVYPTIPFAGSADARGSVKPEARFAVIEALARRGLIEWAVVDPGSVNLTHRRELAAGRSGFVYFNSEDDIRHGLELARRYGFHPSYACYEPGFVRLGAALAGHCRGVPKPLYRFMFSDDIFFGFPPALYALEAYLSLFRGEALAAPWMVAGLAVDISPLVGEAVRRGGHARVGLEDAPFGCTLSNLELTEKALRAIAEAGAVPARAAEVRAAFADAKS